MAERGGRIERVVLVGFMASGKSTVGRALADRLGWRFADFDALIEARTGRTIAAIFAEDGEPAFRALEAELTDALGCAERVVLAPGGGWITQPGTPERLCAGSFMVWLRVTPEEAVRRAAADAVHRPLLAGGAELEKARLLIAEREPYYRLADAVLDVDGERPAELALRIAELVEADEG